MYLKNTGVRCELLRTGQGQVPVADLWTVHWTFELHKGGNILSSCDTISFSRRTPLSEVGYRSNKNVTPTVLAVQVKLYRFNQKRLMVQKLTQRFRRGSVRRLHMVNYCPWHKPEMTN